MCNKSTRTADLGRKKLNRTGWVGAATLIVGVMLSGCASTDSRTPATPLLNGQWDLCTGLSPDVQRHAGFVDPSQDDLDEGYDPTGSADDDARTCNRVTRELVLSFTTWTGDKYAQLHGPDSTAVHGDVTAVTIGGRDATQTHDSDRDCRLVFHLEDGNVIVMTARKPSKQNAATACGLLRPVATALVPTMPR